MSRKGMLELETAMDDPANEIGTAAWARESSDEALQFHLQRNEPNKPSYQMAVRELARRDAARSETLQIRWIKRTFWATIILGVVAIAATLIT